jgi:hypothetical protein
MYHIIIIASVVAWAIKANAAYRKCMPPTMSSDAVLFLGFDPCTQRVSHGWVAYFPSETKTMYPLLNIYAQNNTNSNGSIVEINESGKCAPTSVRQLDRFGLTIE